MRHGYDKERKTEMKILNYFTRHGLVVTDAGIRFGFERLTEGEAENAMKEINALPACNDYNHPTLNGHCTALACLPCVVGTRWAVSHATFDHFLGFMPSIELRQDKVSVPFRYGFAMSEACAYDVRSADYKDEQGRYWHEYISRR